jgi:hypothetical protein
METHYTNLKSNKKSNLNVTNIVIKKSSYSTNKSSNYKCEYCNKNLSSRQSKWRHTKNCDKKNEIELRLENLENQINSNIDTESIIKLMNLNINNIKIINNLIDSLYYNNTLKKISKDLINSIYNNVKSFQVLSKNKKKFDKELREQVNYNLGFITKIEKFSEFIEYEGKKIYLFRTNANNLKKIIWKKEQEDCLIDFELVKFDDFENEPTLVRPYNKINLNNNNKEILDLNEYESFDSESSDFDI